MYSLGEHFKTNKENLKANDASILSGPKYRITVLTDRLIRLEYQENGRFVDDQTMLVKNRNFPVIKFQKIETEVSLEIKTNYFHLVYEKSKPFISGDPNVYYLTVKGESDTIWYPGHSETNNYLGSNGDLLDKEEKELSKGLYSLDGFSSIDDSKSLLLDEEGTIYEADFPRQDIYLFMYGKDFGYALNDYFRLTGFPSFIPRYALGNWWCKEYPYSINNLISLAMKFKDEGVPISTFLIDKNWATLNSSFTFNKDLIPNPEELFKALHNLNLKVGLYLNPLYGIRPTDIVYEESRKYLSPREDGVIPLEATDPRFIDVYLKIIKRPIQKLGIDFFWNDYKGDYKSLWALNHYLYLDDIGINNERPLLLARNSHFSPHLYPIVYGGNTINSWENLKKIPFYIEGGANIGLSLISVDVGGFESGIEDSSLYIRAVQLGVFSPIFRFHTRGNPYYKREPWKWDSATSYMATKYMRLRHQLVPYLYTEVYKYHVMGKLFIEPYYYMKPNYYNDLVLRNAYFLGNSLFVVPLTEPLIKHTHFSKVKINLPSGIWFNIFTGESYTGDNDYITLFRLDQYPVFAFKGSIIVKNNDHDLNLLKNPSNLEIEVYPGKNNIYKLYEDDGNTSDYLKGKYLKTSFQYIYKEKEYEFIVEPVEGTNEVVPTKRNYQIRFKNMFNPSFISVLVKNKELEYSYFREKFDFILTINNVSTLEKINISLKGDKLEISNPVDLKTKYQDLIGDLMIPTDYKETVESIFLSSDPLGIKLDNLNMSKPQGLSNDDYKIVEDVLKEVFS